MTVQEFLTSPAFYWILAACAFCILEAVTQGLTSIWFAGGAVVAATASLKVDSLIMQVLIFVLVSLVLLYFTRPIAKAKFATDITPMNVDALIGMTGMAESDVDGQVPGTVRADNKVWTAVLAEGSPKIENGDLVTITAIDGVKLVVKKQAAE
ncbi:MAG: NfeD family protein [Clostridia bacterium]|nr:NfeD family protein [Clostridia bacterium]